MKIAILGSSGHYGLATADEAEAFRPLEFSMAPVETGEDMGPVGRALKTPPAAFDDWRKLLDEAKPSVAVVNPPFHRIAAVTRECLERGIHVLAEKPLATGWADFLAIRGLVSSTGPKLMAMFTMRYDPIFRAARKAVAEGAVGAPVLLSAQKSYPIQGWDGAPRPAFYRKRSSYGGSIPWVGIHPIDLFLWFSESSFTEAYAAQTLAGNAGNDELESAAVMQFKLASGALADARLDFLRQRGRQGRPEGAGLEVDGKPSALEAVPYGDDLPWGDDRFRVAGDKGVLEIRDGKAVVEGPEGRRELAPEPPASLFAAFLDWIEKGQPMLMSTQDCLRAVEAALRARDAADWGRVQTF